MQTAIGRQLNDLPSKKYAAFSVGVGTVALDLICIIQRASSNLRLTLALTAFALIVYLTNGDLKSIGLQPRPQQGWSPWVRTSIKIGFVVAICIIVGWGTWSLSGRQIPYQIIQPSHFKFRFFHSCIIAPIMEETIYRVVVCVSLISVLGYWKTIAVNGVLFGLLHVLYGNPSPENLLGGFFLAWVYLKSETILLPLLLHSLGNFIVLVGNIAAWYILMN